MKNFTKEYIKECDCKEIQGLKPNRDKWDFVYIGDPIYPFKKSRPVNIFENISVTNPWNNLIWLPTGDQVEEEIVKIIDKNKNLDYKFTRQGMVKKYYAEITDYSIHSGKDGYYIVHSENSLNPYIAKIKLLKKLLKVKK